MEKIKIFDSGLKLIVKKMSGIYTACCGVFVGVGSSMENTATNGYSHFIEHLLFKGTKKRSALEISEEIDNVGGQLNAYTSKDVTCFYTRTMSEHTEKSMELLSDMFFDAQFDSEEIEREKKVVIEEILMDEDMPDSVCHDLLAEAFYGNHALGMTITGKPQNIKKATRESLLSYKNRCYVPSNMCIALTGDVDFENACALTEKYFEKRFNKKRSEPVLSLVPAVTDRQFKYAFKEVEQAHIAVAFPGAEFASDKYYALGIASFMLGGGMSSRLFQTIREKNGLAYTVYTYPSAYKNNGYMEVYAATTPKNTSKLVQLMKSEIKRFVEDGFKEAEFNKGKEQLKGNLVMGQENPLGIMSAYANYFLKTGEVYDLKKRLKRIEAITPEQVLEASRKCFDFSACSAVYVGQKTDDFRCVENFIE